jgi:hypothetical protein
MPETIVPSNPVDWLDDAHLRRGGPRMTQIAIARAWLEGPYHAERRARLVDCLVKLALDPSTPVRDNVSAYRLLACSMTGANLRMLGRSFSRQSKPRQHRMRARPQGPDRSKRPTAVDPPTCSGHDRKGKHDDH